MGVPIPILDDAQWQGLRASCVATASTVGALLAPHPYETPFSLWARAVTGRTGRPDLLPAMDPDLAAIGHDAELMIPARVRRTEPRLELEKDQAFWRHERLRFGGTPDFRDRNTGQTWQAKCVAPWIFREAWRDEPPVHVLLQHQAELLLTEQEKGGVVALVRDAAFSTELYPIARHDGVAAAIERAVGELQERVANLDPPERQMPRDARVVIALHQAVDPRRTIDRWDDRDLVAACRDWLALQEEIERARDAQAVIKARVLESIGDAARVKVGSYAISAHAVEEDPPHRITASDVGRVIAGRKGYRNFKITKGSGRW